jgi:hypothetical protein
MTLRWTTRVNGPVSAWRLRSEGPVSIGSAGYGLLMVWIGANQELHYAIREEAATAAVGDTLGHASGWMRWNLDDILGR